MKKRSKINKTLRPLLGLILCILPLCGCTRSTETNTVEETNTANTLKTETDTETIDRYDLSLAYNGYETDYSSELELADKKIPIELWSSNAGYTVIKIDGQEIPLDTRETPLGGAGLEITAHDFAADKTEEIVLIESGTADHILVFQNTDGQWAEMNIPSEIYSDTKDPDFLKKQAKDLNIELDESVYNRYRTISYDEDKIIIKYPLYLDTDSGSADMGTLQRELVYSSPEKGFQLGSISYVPAANESPMLFTDACTGQPQLDHCLSDYLQVPQETCIPAEQEVQATGIIMSVNSYYRGEHSAVILLSFERTDGKELEENLKPGEISLLEGSVGEVLYNDVIQSEDKKTLQNVLTCSIQNTDSNLLKVRVKNISTQDGLIKYEGSWETALDIGQEPAAAALVQETNPIQVKIHAAKTEYTVQQAAFDRNTLFLKCDAKEYTPPPTELLSSYWERSKKLSITYGDGKEDIQDLECYPCSDGNLYLTVTDVRQLEGVKQLYLDGKALLK